MKSIIHGDAIKWANEYEGELFHALFCDSPYHLTTIVKRFGKTGAAPARFGTDGVFARSSKGFMGQDWDGGDVAFRPETWAAYMRVMYPGAFGMTFAGSRGWHRLAVAIEDAGFIIHPTIFGWLYGSGFPKATRVKEDPEKVFEGHRYGLQALKPALEPIIVFQKPYEGRPLDNIKQTGAGVLNIDAGRIGTDQIPSNQWSDSAHPFGNGAGNDYETVMSTGRWPANFILLDQGAADALDRQSGNTKSGQVTSIKEGYAGESTIDFLRGISTPENQYSDSGGASRFFFQVQQQIDEADPVKYAAKAGAEEREAGLDIADLYECGTQYGLGEMGNKKTTAHKNAPTRNPHPTVKPLSLTRYLASLLLPPIQYAPRRLFVPFAGVGSEVIGGMQAGWEDVQGVELTKKYIPIGNARIKYWANQGWQTELFKLPKE